MRSWAAMAVAVLVLGALSGGAAYENGGPRAADWREIAWPFPRDGWPAGRAFRCASCDAAVEVYVRPKSAFAIATSGLPTTTRSIVSPISIS